ncbi:hypothetical protein [Amycolatopsis sp. TNS106]|uniref:hypothetical protein n=1 Tax=Amycolatopsis sp. TNS106 TaxID=2861750 RepID=UPI001C55CCCC|nr:hypothetical protein [Amycolatopsis sp. TNS106]
MTMLLTLFAGGTTMTWAAHQTVLDRQNAKIAELGSRLGATRQEHAGRAERDLLQSLGISAHRTDSDTRRLTALVKTAMTWDSGPGYEHARASLMTRFGLKDDSLFLREFMPPARYNHDASGKRYYYIDAQGLNSSVREAPDINVVSALGGVYTYVVLADVDVTSDAIQQNNTSPARVTATRRVPIFATIDAQGEVTNLSAVSAQGATRRSR